MQTKGQEAASRFKGFVEETLAAAVCRISEPLTAEVFQTPDRITVAEALRGAYRPVQVGWRWGPLWSSAWFRVKGRVPEAMTGKRVCLRYSSGTEALLWKDGVPHHGFDANRDTVLLHDPAAGGEAVDLLIEAACNHVLGTTQLWWEPPEKQAKWKEPEPGRLEACELVTVDQDAWRLMRTFEFARLLVEQLPDDSTRLTALVGALERAMADALCGSTPACEMTEELEAALAGRGVASPTQCFTVGHAHLDTAWLWPIAETKRKALRTFANSLRLMERFPHYRFLCSQPQQYAWVKERSPELFNQIRARVKEKRWEPMGAMWIEPDGNLPSGESFVRQIIHGVRFWKDEFGEAAPQRLAYLPDTFGFAASLPQIFRLAGLDTFITNKLWWNQTNEFPYTHFRWRGIDGTEILSHLTPGHEYNATNTPKELLLGQRFAESKDPAGVHVWLQPFGFGDGGGGPTDWNILYAGISAHAEGLPNTNSSGAAAFCERFHRRVGAVGNGGTPLPVWDGELYLERHRGTYTTQAAVKRGNAVAEASLRITEWLAFAGPTRLPDGARINAADTLDAAWKTTLLNQFHDILPGSSIGEVYTDAAVDQATVRAACAGLEREAMQRWASQADTSGMHEPVVVFNPGSAEMTGWVEWQDSQGRTRGLIAERVPAMGFRVFEATVPVGHPVTESEILDNGIVRARIDRRGRILSLERLGTSGCGNLASERGLNELVLYQDRPATWDAWDIEEEHLHFAQSVEDEASEWQVTRLGPHMPREICVKRALGARSSISQAFSLAPGSARLDIRTVVEWGEDRILLRALFNTTIRAGHATYEIPFGHISRPTTRNHSRERAMFEVPAHRWMDLSEPARGLAVLNDCKYGHSCHGGVMGLSLLRSPKWPDPEADMGVHEFTYSLMPHNGDWRAAGVDRQAELMARPMWAVPLSPGRQGPCGQSWAPFRISGTAAVRIAAIKPAESGDARTLIVRIVENHGRAGSCRLDWALPVTTVQSVDLLERPLSLPISHDPGSRATMFDIKPFQIITLAVTLAN